MFTQKNSPKKVLFVTNNYPVPDYRRLWKKAVSLAQDDYEVRVICPAGRKKQKKRKLKGVKIYYFDKATRDGSLRSFIRGEFKDLMRVSRKVGWLFLGGRFQVLHVMNPTDTLGLVGIFYRLLGIKLVYEVNESFSAKFKRERIRIRKGDRLVVRLLEKLERLAVKMADLVVVPDFKQRTRVAQIIKEKKNRIVTIEPLPDLKDFYSLQLNRDYKRGFQYLALYAGSLKIERGILKIIGAIEFIVNKLGRKDILFVLAGEGRDEEKIKEYALQKGVSKYLHFPGWLSQNKLLAYMTEADMGLAPELAQSDNKTLGDSVFEYLAVGKPVVSFDAKASGSRIGRAGAFVRDLSEVSFAREIIRVIDNKDRSKAMGEMGKIRVERDLNWLKSEIKLLAAYERLFTNKAKLGEKSLAGKAA